MIRGVRFTKLCVPNYFFTHCSAALLRPRGISFSRRPKASSSHNIDIFQSSQPIRQELHSDTLQCAPTPSVVRSVGKSFFSTGSVVFVFTTRYRLSSNDVVISLFFSVSLGAAATISETDDRSLRMVSRALEVAGQYRLMPSPSADLDVLRRLRQFLNLFLNISLKSFCKGTKEVTSGLVYQS